MAVIKQGRGMGEVVFVDSGTSDMDSLPDAVKQAFSSESGNLPKVALSNASGDKVYGTSSHKALLGGLDKALRDAKRAMKADTTPGAAPAKPAAAAAGKTPAASDIKVTDKGGSKEITGAPVEEWVSSKGTKLSARLTRVAGAKLTFVTDANKTITVNQTDLAPESFQRLQEIIAK
jgi:hypothetical protein